MSNSLVARPEPTLQLQPQAINRLAKVFCEVQLATQAVQHGMTKPTACISSGTTQVYSNRELTCVLGQQSMCNGNITQQHTLEEWCFQLDLGGHCMTGIAFAFSFPFRYFISGVRVQSLNLRLQLFQFPTLR